MFDTLMAFLIDCFEKLKLRKKIAHVKNHEKLPSMQIVEGLTKVVLLCIVSGCTQPPGIPNAYTKNTTTGGYDVCYECLAGFENVGGDESCSSCTINGTWTDTTIKCKQLPFQP